MSYQIAYYTMYTSKCVSRQTWSLLKNNSKMFCRCQSYAWNPINFKKTSSASEVNFLQHVSFTNSGKTSVLTNCLKNVSLANIHTTSLNKKEIDFKEYKQLQNEGVTVIDVRQTNEIKSSGTIPGSLNIPIEKLNNALNQSEKDFKVNFGRNKPNKNESVLFLCQHGVRSKKALEVAAKLGYNKAMSFKGGWEHFSKN